MSRIEVNMKNLEIARKAYAEIVSAIQDLEEKFEEVTYELPEYITVNGQKFTRHQLAMEYLPCRKTIRE